MIVLAGSNASFMEKELADSKTPLYRRNTFQLCLHKLQFIEALETLDDVKDLFEKAKFLSLTNTFPYYLSLLNTSKSFEENLDSLFLMKLQYLLMILVKLLLLML